MVRPPDRYNARRAALAGSPKSQVPEVRSKAESNEAAQRSQARLPDDHLIFLASLLPVFCAASVAWGLR
jgi:hypothetical protein